MFNLFFNNIHLICNFIVQCQVNSLENIENNVKIKTLPQFLEAIARMQIEPFVFDVPPETFDEHVIKGAFTTIHAL